MIPYQLWQLLLSQLRENSEVESPPLRLPGFQRACNYSCSFPSGEWSSRSVRVAVSHKCTCTADPEWATRPQMKWPQPAPLWAHGTGRTSNHGPGLGGPSRFHRQCTCLSSVPQPCPGSKWVFTPYFSHSSCAPAVEPRTCLAGNTAWPGVLAGRPRRLCLRILLAPGPSLQNSHLFEGDKTVMMTV